eukprot:1319879-Amorphochlora_amoeboformis.AAC.1
MYNVCMRISRVDEAYPSVPWHGRCMCVPRNTASSTSSTCEIESAFERRSVAKNGYEKQGFERGGKWREVRYRNGSLLLEAV